MVRRDQLGKVLTSGNGKPSQGLVTETPKPCTGDTVTGNLPAHDVTAAKSALDAAGWVVGTGGLRAKDGKKLALTLLYPTQLGPTLSAGAELIQQAWKAVGVQVTVKGVDSPGLNQIAFGTGAWDAGIIPVGVALPSQLRPFVSGPVPPDGTNLADIQNKDYDRLVEQAASKAGIAGCPDWNQAETALIRAVDIVPFVEAVTPTFAKGATFDLVQSLVIPQTIRMHAG